MSVPKHRKAQPRPILAAKVAELRVQGLNGMQIAEQLQISKSYAYVLITDPSGEDERRRKEKYCGTCRNCGARTSYDVGGPVDLCRPCSTDERTIWTCDAIVCAIQEWEAEHGRPPGARDWNPAMARREGRHDIADRFYKEGCWPNTWTVQWRFGSWSAAIVAAGFPPMPMGKRYNAIKRAAA